MQLNLTEKEKALACQEQSLRIRRLNYGTSNESVAQCLFCLGDIHLLDNELDNSLKCFSESKEIFMENIDGDHVLIAKVLTRIANVHSYLYNDSEAIDYYQKSLSMYKKCLDLDEYVIAKISSNSDSREDYVDYAESAYNLGIVYEAIEKYDAAKEYLTESLRIFKFLFGKEDLNVAKSIDSKEFGRLTFEQIDCFVPNVTSTLATNSTRTNDEQHRRIFEQRHY